MQALQELAEVSTTLENSHVKAWKSDGRSVVGFVCSYVPEEIPYALDILPFRITGRGVQDTSHADSYLTRVNCSFARCCLELGFTGQYDFLDGAVWINGCDHIRRCYDNWKAQAPLPFMHMLPVPHRLSDEGRQWFKEEVLEFQRAVEGHFGVKLASHRLAETVAIYNESRRLLRKVYDLRLKEKGLSLRIEIDDTHVPIKADPFKLEQVFINLIDNAIKYTEQGDISITVAHEQKHVAIVIEDTGIGMPDSDHARIFERFYVVDKSRSRKVGGTGLGLSIVKHIILLHRGNVTVKSTPGVGTAFSIRLPRA